jgi:hypothetical protein
VHIEKLTDDLIDDAILWFGEPINDWKLTRIEFKEQGPYTKYYPHAGEISICLSEKVYGDNFQLILQLSHEICHVLHPSIEYPSLVCNKTLVINEGISTFFSILSSQKYFTEGKDLALYSLRHHSPNYYNAYLLMDRLLQIDLTAIKRLRDVQPRVDKLLASDFKKCNLNVSEGLIVELLTPFK